MTLKLLTTLISNILFNVSKLRRKYIEEQLGGIDYVGIIPRSIRHKKDLIDLIKKLKGTSIYKYTDNYGELFYLPSVIKTRFGKTNLITICNELSESKIGYVDFQTSNYYFLKEKYSKIPRFRLIYGKGWEMIGLEDDCFNVSLYLPNIPLSKDPEVMSKIPKN